MGFQVRPGNSNKFISNYLLIYLVLPILLSGLVFNNFPVPFFGRRVF